MTSSISADQSAAPFLRALVVDGMRLRAFPAGQDARLEAWMGADPYTHTVHVRARHVPVVNTCDTASPLVQLARGTRVPGVT